MSRPWSGAELALVADQALSLREVAELTGRPYSSVKVKASRLGIRRHHPWSEPELELLYDTSLSLVQVAVRTGRKLGTVYAEASIRKVGGRVQGRPRGANYEPRVEGPRRPQWRLTEEDLALLADTSLSYDDLAVLTGLDRESLRKAAYYRGWTRGQPTGEDAHRWKGGVKQRLQAAGPEWDAAREAALERDGYSCQDCPFTDLTGSRLHVHHVIPWRLRRVNDLEWLATLCLRCHGKRPEHYWTEIPEDVALLLSRSVEGGPPLP